MIYHRIFNAICIFLQLLSVFSIICGSIDFRCDGLMVFGLISNSVVGIRALTTIPVLSASNSKSLMLQVRYFFIFIFRSLERFPIPVRGHFFCPTQSEKYCLSFLYSSPTPP